MRVYSSVTELIGNTPLLELKNIEKELNLKGKIFAKLECFNPAGSSKDRIAKYMLEKTISTGKKPTAVIEPTSGNTGIGLACVCASMGIKAIIVMPDNMSEERIRLMKAYGAEVVLTDGKLGMKGSISKAEELSKSIENSLILGQFDNPDNPTAHYLSTGPEIWEDTDGKVDIFVAGIGTGGTVSGTAKFLKEKNKNVKVVGFEPTGSPLITKGYSGSHGLQGIGANFIPSNYDRSVVDEVVTVGEEESFYYSSLVAKKEGVFVGITSGSSVAVAVELAKKPENAGKIIVALLPDTGSRYLSTEGFIK